MRKKFDEQLAELNHSLIRMGAVCEESIALAAKAFTQGERKLVDKIEPLSRELEDMEYEVENLCIKLLLQQQPVAGDMRHISAALKMVTDMKRIGVQAEDIAEIIKPMEPDPDCDFGLINDMATATVRMVTGSVDAFVRQDAALAENIIADDDTVDEYFIKVRHWLIDLIGRKPSGGETALDIMMIAKYLERIADHAVNIAQWVIYSVSGQYKGDKL